MLLFAETLGTVMMLRRRYDVPKITADAILFREIQYKKMDILLFQQHFLYDFGWNMR